MGSATPGVGAVQPLNPAQVYQYIVQAGANTDINGPGSQNIGGVQYSQAEIMTAIAGAESSYNPNNNGDTSLSQYGSVGLWQIFTGAHDPSDVLGTGGSTWTQDLLAELYTPLTNAEAAMRVYKSQGFSAWSTYNSGAYTKYLATATTAAYNAADYSGPAIPGEQPPAPSTGGAVSQSSGGTSLSSILGGIFGSLGGASSDVSGIFGNLGTWLKGGTERIVIFVGGFLLLLLVLWKLGG